MTVHFMNLCSLRSLVLLLLLADAARAQEPPLRLVKTIPLPSVNGRIDHLSITPDGRRLFVAALGNDSVEVLELNEGKRIESIRGLDEPQGVAYLPDLK